MPKLIAIFFLAIDGDSYLVHDLLKGTLAALGRAKGQGDGSPKEAFLNGAAMPGSDDEDDTELFKAANFPYES